MRGHQRHARPQSDVRAAVRRRAAQRLHHAHRQQAAASSATSSLGVDGLPATLIEFVGVPPRADGAPVDRRSARTRRAKCASLVTDYGATPPAPSTTRRCSRLIDVATGETAADARPLLRDREEDDAHEPASDDKPQPRELTGRDGAALAASASSASSSRSTACWCSAATSTFGGVETGSSYKAGLPFKQRDRRGAARRTRCTGRSTASSSRDRRRRSRARRHRARRATARR